MGPKKVRYRTVGEMCNRVTASLGMLPPDLDMVVGIPRSGIIAATMITLYRNLPMTDMEGLFEGRMIKSGHRSIEQINNAGRKCKALVVDDSVASGSQMRAARERLKQLEDRFDFIFAAVYVTKSGAELVDIGMEVCPTPRFFQWNVMNHPYMERSCVDVLALLQPEVSQQAVSSRQLPELWDKAPLFKPKYKFNTLVLPVSQSERERAEQWLIDHGLSFSRLLLAGRDWQGYADARLEAMRDPSVFMGYMFGREEAQDAATGSGLPVFNDQFFEFCYPSTSSQTVRKFRMMYDRARSKLGVSSKAVVAE